MSVASKVGRYAAILPVGIGFLVFLILGLIFLGFGLVIMDANELCDKAMEWLTKEGGR